MEATPSAGNSYMHTREDFYPMSISNSIISTFSKITTEKNRKIREMEMRMVMAMLDGDQALGIPLVLEMGCGSGFQTRILEKVYTVVAIDIAKNEKNKSLRFFLLASALCLPFRDNVFRLVYSSNLMEHLNDRKKSLLETGRVLRKDGVIVTVVPTLYWKSLELLLAPIRWIIEVLTAPLRERSRFLHPSFLIHGAYSSNRQELVSYRVESWVKLHRDCRFKVTGVRRLLGYLPLEFPVPLEFSLGRISEVTVAIIARSNS